MTADTYSNTLGFLIQGTGNNSNTWGASANSAVFQIIEDAIANALTSTVTGGTLDLSGSPPPAAASQARYAALIFNGTLTSNQVVQVPNLRKFWMVQNATAGSFTLKIKTPAGSASTAIPQNSGWQLVYCDGANAIAVMPFNSIQLQMPDGTAALPAYSNVNEPSSGWWRFGTQDWRFSVNGVAVLQLTGTGAATPSVINVLSPNALQVNGSAVLSNGAVVKASDGSVTAPGLTFNSETGTGWYRVGAGDAAFTVLGVQRVEVTSVSFGWLGSTYAGSDLSPTAISTNQNNYNPAGNGLVMTLGSITGGSSYTNGSYTDVALTGGTGTGATANITVSGAAVTAVTLRTRGTGYLAADTLSAAAANIGGTGSGFSVPVSTVDPLHATCLRLNITAACTFTGLAGGSAGREITLVNIGTATGQFTANSGSSSAANRFANTFNIAPGQSIDLRYDATSSLWRLKNVATAFSACAIAAVSPDLLVVNNTGTENTKLDITCSEVVLTDSVGNAIKFENVSVTVDSTVTGANGCDTGTRAANTSYFVYLIADGTSIAGILSTSATTPSLANAANYIFSKRVSWRRTDGSSNFYRMRQKGNLNQYLVTAGSNTATLPNIANGLAGTYSVTSPTLATAVVSSATPTTTSTVPTTATEIGVACFNHWKGASAENVLVAPNTGYGGTNNGPLGSVGQVWPYYGDSAINASAVVWMALEGTTIAWCSGGAAGVINCLGYRDSI